MYSVETTEKGQAVKGDSFNRLKVIKNRMYSIVILICITITWKSMNRLVCTVHAPAVTIVRHVVYISNSHM